MIELLVLLVIFSTSRASFPSSYSSIFSFGDSLADTGNLVALSDPAHLPLYAFPPYGETFFHRSTGRCSDGRLVIDFIADYFGLPYLPPYFGSNKTGFREGVNFAVAGASAVDNEYYEKRGIKNTYTNISLGVQLRLFKELLPSLFPLPSERTERLGRSLIVMGEIGGNDYNHAFMQGIGLEENREFVPLVINMIASTIEELIELGAVTFLVPGNLPIGCIPAYLTYFEGSEQNEYDPQTGCLTWLNEFSQYHNQKLQERLDQIRKVHPHARIFYADYYNAVMPFYTSPERFGFNEETLAACCGRGGPYNYNPTHKCAQPNVKCCINPFSYVNWDGMHYTEATYRLISGAILEGPYTVPSFADFNSLALAKIWYAFPDDREERKQLQSA